MSANAEASSDATRAMAQALLAVLRRRKGLIGLVLAATVVGAYVALSFVSELYEAEARLLVKLGRENTEVPLAVEKGGVYTTGVMKEEINSHIQLLASRALVEAAIETVGIERLLVTPQRPPGILAAAKFYVKQVVRGGRAVLQRVLILLDLKKELTPRQKAIGLVEKSLSATRERDSNVIRLSIRLQDPLLARDLLAALLDQYVQRHIQVQRDANVGQVFEEQALVYRKRLEDLQSSMAQVKTAANLSSVGEQRSQLLERLDGLKSGIDAKSTQLAQLASEHEALRAQLSLLPPSTKGSEVVEPTAAARMIKERLAELRLKRVQAAGQYEEGFQLLADLDAEIASLQKVLGGESATQTGAVTYLRNPVTSEFEAEAERIKVKQVGLEASIREARRQLAAVQAELRRLDEGDDRLRLIELERRVIEEKYLATATRSSAASIAEQLDRRGVANVAVLSPPVVRDEPVYPKKMLLMGVAIAVGLLAGIGLALVLEWASDVVYEPRDLETIDGLPVLGHVRIPPATALAEG